MKHLFSVLLLVFLGINATAQTAEERYETALSQYEKNQIAEAYSSVGKAIKKNNDDPRYYKLRGDCRLKMGKAKSALVDYEKAKKLGMKSTKFFTSRGAAYLVLDEPEKALSDFNKALKMDSTNANAYYNRACANYLSYNLEGAEHDYSKAIELDESFSEAYYFRGVTRSELGDKEEGMADVMKSIEMDTAMNDAYLSLAIIKYEAGQYKEAIEDLDRVISTESDYLPEAYFYRAESKYFLGDKPGACEDWQVAGNMGDVEADEFYYKFCIKGEKKVDRVRRPKKGVISF